MTPLDVAVVKKDFPIFERMVHGHRLVYLDSASSSQKPRSVIDAMDHLYETSYANTHRGVYVLGQESTALYEGARERVQRFINAPSSREILFTKNVTEAINLVAYSWGRANLREGDAVLLTEMEHHANLVPWLVLKEQLGIELRFLPISEDYQLDLSELDRLIDGVKLVGVVGISNVLGTLNPVRHLADAAHALRALTERHGDKLNIFGPSEPAARGGVISFAYEGLHPHDVSQVLDEAGVCVRAGHHCAKPLMRRLGVGATARASLYIYNDEADVDALNEALDEADRLFT